MKKAAFIAGADIAWKQLQDSRNLKALGKGFAWVIGVFLAIFLGLMGAAYMFPHNAWSLSLRDNIDDTHVYVTQRPADCDFLSAPIGNKGCHYDWREGLVRNDAGQITGVQGWWEKEQ
jgi:hypothetical protein